MQNHWKPWYKVESPSLKSASDKYPIVRSTLAHARARRVTLLKHRVTLTHKLDKVWQHEFFVRFKGFGYDQPYWFTRMGVEMMFERIDEQRKKLPYYALWDNDGNVYMHCGLNCRTITEVKEDLWDFIGDEQEEIFGTDNVYKVRLGLMLEIVNLRLHKSRTPFKDIS